MDFLSPTQFEKTLFQHKLEIEYESCERSGQRRGSSAKYYEKKLFFKRFINL